MLFVLQVQTVLDIGCGFGSFGAHLASVKVMAVCIAAYEATGSQVQLALERGLPAVIGNFISRQLPYPSLSYDMVHCAQCGIVWDEKGTPVFRLSTVHGFNLIYTCLPLLCLPHDFYLRYLSHKQLQPYI